MKAHSRGQWLLLITSAIWGFTFSAQVEGMNSLGPFGFMASRYSIGVLALLPLLWLFPAESRAKPTQTRSALLFGALAAGSCLFIASGLQQVGLQYTSAANAGFITSLYLLIVPLLGLCLGQRIHWPVWPGAAIAVAGLYLLSFQSEGDGLQLQQGDALQLAGALFWACHVLLIGYFSQRCPAIVLAIGQFAVCALLSAIATYAKESISLAAIFTALPSLLFAGVLSTAVALTLQIIAQRSVAATPAAMIMSLECVFAALGGWWWLGQALSGIAIFACALILVGILLSQWQPNKAAAQQSL